MQWKTEKSGCSLLCLVTVVMRCLNIAGWPDTQMHTVSIDPDSGTFIVRTSQWSLREWFDLIRMQSVPNELQNPHRRAGLAYVSEEDSWLHYNSCMTAIFRLGYSTSSWVLNIQWERHLSNSGLRSRRLCLRKRCRTTKTLLIAVEIQLLGARVTIQNTDNEN